MRSSSLERCGRAGSGPEGEIDKRERCGCACDGAQGDKGRSMERGSGKGIERMELLS